MAPFTRLDEATPENCVDYVKDFAAESTPEKMAGRMMKMLEGLKNINCCNLVDLYEHNLQSGSRAFRDGADTETVVCALFHDIGEVMSPVCHGEIAASILRPYISDKNYWILQHHEIFQTYYYGKACGVDPDLREEFRFSPYFEACEKFCRDWDMTSFDPDYQSMELDEFAPLVLEVFSRAPYSQTGQPADKISSAKLKIGESDYIQGERN